MNSINTKTNSFISYIKSMGPGIVVVLTWMGAGDLVESAMAGGNYGYSLMWSFVIALFIRYLFVSIIAKYQLCNPHGESVISGLCRVHIGYAPFIFFSGLLVAHGVGVYLLMGLAEVCVKITNLGEVWIWAIILSGSAFLCVYQPVYRRTEKVILVLAALLSLSLLSLAFASRPSPLELTKGVFGFSMPQTIGRFDALFLAISMIGAVGGGLANFMYPYFIREKGWNKPEHRKLQQYDLIFGILVLIILDLSVWTVGAEILHPQGIQVVDLNSLARLLSETLGILGNRLFYFGVFAALFSSIVGNGAAYGYLISDSFQKMSKQYGIKRRDASYRWIAAWVILSPLPWVVFGKSDFVGVTIAINAAQVVLIPALVLGVWIITSREKFIGRKYRNTVLENVFIGFMLLLGAVAAYFSLERILTIFIY